MLKTIFQVVPGGIKDIWDINEFEIIDHQVEIAQDALHYLEKSQVLGLKNITIKRRNGVDLQWGLSRRNQGIY